MEPEWMRVEDRMATIGITKETKEELGEVVYIQLPPLGAHLVKGQEAVIIESTKAATDIYSPASGEVVEVNSGLLEHLEWINQSPEEKGWLFKLKLIAD